MLRINSKERSSFIKHVLFFGKINHYLAFISNNSAGAAIQSVKVFNHFASD